MSVDSDVLIKVEGVSKKFCRSLKRSLWYGMQDIAHELNPFASRKKSEVRSQKSEEVPSDVGSPTSAPGLRPGEFWAVDDVSFELRRGECLGLIGQNGAGKTTLLKMLNGLIKPDSGRIEMRGRVGALIALGAGFNPILTGRENIYVNGAVLGLTKKETDSKIDEIIDFAELCEFIDTPVQSYSSGMQVRLGFAVASSLEPHILILDEVLAVGDYAFRIKCLNRVSELIRNTAVLFVSHSTDLVRRICSKVLYLNQGKMVQLGDVDEAIHSYESDTMETESEGYVHPTIRDPKLITPAKEVAFRQPFRMQLSCESTVDHRRLAIRVHFGALSGESAAEWCSADYGQFYDLKAGEVTAMDIEISSMAMRPGVYYLSYALTSDDGKDRFVKAKDATSLKVTGPRDIFHLRPL
jgi:lipopolysaccharide transport system ATP-binding protein